MYENRYAEVYEGVLKVYEKPPGGVVVVESNPTDNLRDFRLSMCAVAIPYAI